jgi:hypothetical protein
MSYTTLGYQVNTSSAGLSNYGKGPVIFKLGGGRGWWCTCLILLWAIKSTPVYGEGPVIFKLGGG